MFGAFASDGGNSSCMHIVVEAEDEKDIENFQNVEVHKGNSES